MPSVYKPVFVDNSGEKCSTTIYLPALSSANYDSVAGNDIGDNLGNLRIAIAAVTRCNFVKHNLTGVSYADLNEIPADADAQNEIRLRIDYTDNVNGRTGYFTIPAPNLDVFGQTGSDVIDPEEITVAALFTAIETYAVSRDDHPITVQKGVVVGRR